MAAYLGGRGVRVDEALWEILMQPIHQPFKDLVNAGIFRRIMAARGGEGDELPDEVEQKMLRLLQQVKQLAQGSGDEASIARDVRRELEAILRWPVIDGHPLVAAKSRHQRTAQYLQSRLDGDPQAWGILLGWLFTHALGRVAGERGTSSRAGMAGRGCWAAS